MTDAIKPPREGQLEVAGAVEPVADEWDELALRTRAPPFARPGWIGAWWEAFGRGSLSVLALRRDGDLEGVLPLARRRGILRSCSNVHTPLFDCVASDGAGAGELLSAARGMAQAVLLERIDSEGLLSEAARRAGADRSALRVVSDELDSPYVAAGIDPAEYERSLGSSRRSQLRRKRRRLAEVGELTHLALEGAEAREQLEERFEQLLDLEGSGWKARTGTAIRSRPETLLFYSRVARWAADNDLLRLSFLCLDERPVVGWMLIGDEARVYSIKTGFDEGLSRYSPGMLLTVEEIGHALGGGRTFELGAGMNRLKEDLHNARRRLEHVGVFQPGARGALARWSVQGHDAAYRRARSSAGLRAVRDTVRRWLARAPVQLPMTDALLVADGLPIPVA